MGEGGEGATWDPIPVPLSGLLGVRRWRIALKLLGRWCGCGSQECTVCRRRCLLTLTDGKDLWMPCEGTDGQLYDLMELLRYAKFKGLPVPSAVDPSQELVEVRLCRRRKLSFSGISDGWRRGSEGKRAKENVEEDVALPTRTLAHALPKALVYHAPSAAIWLTTNPHRSQKGTSQ